ncbi:MAG: OmpA family protein [Ignavibacteria bacterium]|nr:OmpA family protein [Ignavibacteria bacterium]
MKNIWKTIVRFALAVLVFGGTLSVYAQEDNKITSKFDFIPGEKVVYFDDFTSDNIGDFPALWNTNGSGEIVTSSKYPGRWLQFTAGGYYIPEVVADFTDNYTIEFDMVPLNSENIETIHGISLLLVSGSLKDPNEGGAVPGKSGLGITPEYDMVNWSNWSEADGGYKDNGQSPYMFMSTEMTHISLWIQKQRVRMYARDRKILDLPRGLIAPYKYNIFRIQISGEATPLFSNIRIAAGLPDMRNKLLTTGKLISYGIFFDVNSDLVKPESDATLKEIAQVMKDNPQLSVKIVGHTDADGDNALNLDLSKRRGASVKKELVEKFGVEAARLESDGKGETELIAANDTPMNKAKNRRVEFIRK